MEKTFKFNFFALSSGIFTDLSKNFSVSLPILNSMCAENSLDEKKFKKKDNRFRTLTLKVSGGFPKLDFNCPEEHSCLKNGTKVR